MNLHILGSGCPLPGPGANRYGSAFVLEIDPGNSIMVDCGPATTFKMAKMNLSPLCVKHLFFTHHHFDHNVDFPCFFLTRWDMSKGDEPPLAVYGPPPTEAFVEKLIGKEGAFFEDWNSRIKHPASHACHRWRGGILPRPVPRATAKNIGPGKIAATDSWSVTAESVHHVEPFLESLVYRFETDQGSILFAGDCGDCRQLRQIAAGVNTLVAACTHFSDTLPAIMDVITGTKEASAIAKEAGVKNLILTHVNADFSKPGVKERAVAEIARNCSSCVFFPEELTTINMRREPR